MNQFSAHVTAAMHTCGVGPGYGIEPLAALDYEVECAVKREALRQFAYDINVPDSVLKDLRPSTMPRGYRTTSRRRVVHRRGKIELTHGDGGSTSAPSPLEQQGHAEIYETVSRLMQSMSPFITQIINHVIIRGTYTEYALIVNVSEMSADCVRAVRSLCTKVRTLHPLVQHAWMYFDPKASKYYLELERPASGVGAKKLFGAAAWMQKVGNVQYQVGVFSFSQVNLASTELLVNTVLECGGVKAADTVFDVYCGYGLFSAPVAQTANVIVAIDADENTVANARYNIQRAGTAKVAAVRGLLRKAEDVETALRLGAKISRHIPEPESTVLLLDPPRAGTGEGIVQALAEVLQPRCAVEVFCGPDEVLRSVREWRKAGYQLQRMIPVDMFAGTAGMELVCEFTTDDAPEPTRTPQRTSGRPRR